MLRLKLGDIGLCNTTLKRTRDADMQKDTKRARQEPVIWSFEDIMGMLCRGKQFQGFLDESSLLQIAVCSPTLHALFQDEVSARVVWKGSRWQKVTRYTPTRISLDEECKLLWKGAVAPHNITYVRFCGFWGWWEIGFVPENVTEVVIDHPVVQELTDLNYTMADWMKGVKHLTIKDMLDGLKNVSLPRGLESLTLLFETNLCGMLADPFPFRLPPTLKVLRVADRFTRPLPALPKGLAVVFLSRKRKFWKLVGST